MGKSSKFTQNKKRLMTVTKDTPFKKTSTAEEAQKFVTDFLQSNISISKFNKNEAEEVAKKFMVTDFSASNQKSKSLKRKSKKGQIKRLTWSEIREKKLFDIGKEGHKYKDYIPLNNLWEQYMKDLIEFPKLNKNNFSSAEAKMTKADLHGCRVTVERSKCPSYVGTCGIILQETRNVFKLVTEENKIKCIPKANSVFCIVLEDYKFTIYGNNFLVKSNQRVTKKFKLKPTIDL